MWYVVTQQYLRMDNHIMAANMFRKAIEINPMSQHAQINLLLHLSEYGMTSLLHSMRKSII